MRSFSLPLIFLLLGLTFAGCQTTVMLDPQSREESAWLRTEIYVAVARLEDPTGGISEADWQDFLDQSVSNRFPDGFTLFSGIGQWRSMERSEAAPVRLDSRVIVILHPNTPEAEAKIEGIRTDFTQRFGHESALRATMPATVSF